LLTTTVYVSAPPKPTLAVPVFTTRMFALGVTGVVTVPVQCAAAGQLPSLPPLAVALLFPVVAVAPTLTFSVSTVLAPAAIVPVNVQLSAVVPVQLQFAPLVLANVMPVGSVSATTILPIVLLPAGRIAAGKLAQAIVHGAQVVQVEGNFDDCLRLARSLAESYPVALVNSVNPVRIEGQKTAAFEVVDDLGDAPDLHVLPVGNGGNISAYWRGYVQYAEAGISSRRPRMWAFQAAGAAPLVLGHPVPNPETVATAIRIGDPASTTLAVAAKEESGGRFGAVTDDQILAAQGFLAAREGVFVEPASAAGVAGLLGLAERGEVDPGQRIVVTVTGHGLKDIDTALSGRTVQAEVVAAELTKVAQACGLAG
jgi:threonine synthase